MELGAGGYVAIPMPRGATDFNAELQVADDAGVTHIIVQNVSSPAALLAENALEFFGEREFYEFGCLNWCADETLINLAGDAAEGVFGVLPFTPTTVEVPGQDIPREILGGQEALEEASLHYTQGWAAMDIMTEAIRIVVANGEEVTGPSVRAAMETITDYDTGGLTAPVTFTAEDHRATRAAAVFAVDGGVWMPASDGLIDLRDMMMDDMESDE
jgi:branched-chain amino acid transport system substrate-binding protein